MGLKKLLAVLTIAVAAVALVGCGSGSAEEPNQTDAAVGEVNKVTLPQERPDLIGKVKEIVGNEVTMYKAEMNTGESTSTSDQQIEEQQTDNQQAAQQAGPGKSGFKMNFSETAETITIPVGTPIVSRQRGANEVTEVGLSGIKQDSILQIWRQDDTITFVQVMAVGGSNSGTNGSEQNRRMDGPPDMGGPPPGMGGK